MKEWIISLLQHWYIFAIKEHKMKNKIQIKKSPLQVVKSIA
jgi:hypothetical protein